MELAVTYNFDPDEWYEREKAALERKRRDGLIDDDELADAVEELDRRLAEMWKRLDGTYRMPE
jgi:hypothetical protein